MSSNEKSRKRKRDRYWEAVRAGLCVKCGAPAEPARRRCEMCLVYDRGTPAHLFRLPSMGAPF